MIKTDGRASYICFEEIGDDTHKKFNGPRPSANMQMTLAGIPVRT